MLRLLLHHAGTRRLAAQALKRLESPQRRRWLHDELELARYLHAKPVGDETPTQAIERALEERHAAPVTVSLDRRGITITPRGHARPTHRLLYPVPPSAVEDSARRVAQAATRPARPT